MASSRKFEQKNNKQDAAGNERPIEIGKKSFGNIKIEKTCWKKESDLGRLMV